MIITIAGIGGTGKSTVAKIVAKKLGYKHYSVGDLQRQIARDRGITIKELGELEADDNTMDNMIDEKTKKLGKREDNFVIDSWLAAKFIPKEKAFRVFLTCDLDIRAKRVKGGKRDVEGYKTLDEAKMSLLSREKCNRERFIEFYDFDFMDESNYDLVVDTSELNAEEVAGKVVEAVK